MFQRNKNSPASLPLRQLGINHGCAQCIAGHYTRSGDVSENKQLCRAGLHRRYGETKRASARISERAGESRRVTPMCAVHASFLLTLLTMSNTMGFKETSRQQDCCTSQPFSHQNTRCTTLTQSVAGRS